MRPAGMKRILPRAAALILALLLVFACAASAFAKEGDAPGTPAGDTTTIGASEPTGDTGTGEGQASQEGAGESEADLEKRKEVYTITALVTLGAILVGIRERRRGK